MKVIHPIWTDNLEGGIKTSLDHQRECFERKDIEVTEKFDKDADVLHVNILDPRDYYYLQRAKLHGIPVVIHTHEIGENFKESFRFSNQLAPFVKRYVDFFYKRADLLICPTPYAAETLEERGIKTEKTVVSNGIKKERFEGLDEVETEFESDNFQAINVSIIFERKGLSDFIETARELYDTDFKWFGTKFGKFLRSSSVDEKIESAPENLEFPGFVKDIRECFAAGDAFFFPTKSETQGISVLEAAYCGLPIVVRDIPVYEDWLTDEVNCLKADSVEGFVDCLERLKYDSGLREKLSMNGQELAQEHTLDSISEQLEEAYEKAIELKK